MEIKQYILKQPMDQRTNPREIRKHLKAMKLESNEN